MFQKKDFTPCGRVVKPHGVKGLQRMELSDFDVDTFFEQDAFFFFDIDGTYIPFAVESIEWLTDSEALVKIEDIEDNNAADFLSGKTVYMLRADAERTGLEIKPVSLKGYAIDDEQAGALGVITDIDDTTVNIIVRTDKGHTLPLHDDFINGIDDNKQIVSTCYPKEILDFIKVFD